MSDLCRKHGVSDASVYKWKARYGGMEVSEAKRLKSLEDENTKLKRMLADAMLDNVALKDLLEKNGSAHRTAPQPACLKRGASPHSRTHQRRPELHASVVTEQHGRPIRLLLTAGQLSDFKGAALLLDTLPKAKTLLGDRGYDANWFRNALKGKGINPSIPSKRNRKNQIEHDKMLYKQRHKVETMFAKLKDCRRVHTRYDRCAHTFFSAIRIAATVAFGFNES